MFQETVRVLYNRKIAPDTYRMGVACPGGYRTAIPGQFVMVRVSDRPVPLLRRPFSIHRLIRENGRVSGFEMLYRVVGVTTLALSTVTVDKTLNVVGPLGRGFVLPEHRDTICIAAGGIGVAPLLFLGDYLLEKQVRPEAITVYIGGRSREDLLCETDFSRIGLRVVTTTDDGSAGQQCLITNPLEQGVRDQPPDVIYACGPEGMLACVAGIAKAHGVPCQISIETLMACGMGACLGCAVESGTDPTRYLHACMDGPVMDVKELKCNFR